MVPLLMAASAPTAGPVTRRLRGWRWLALLLLLICLASIAVNLWLYSRYHFYYAGSKPPAERFYDGDRTATAKIARIAIVGTISPPFTARALAALERATEDTSVKAVLLVIDSPGGLVADSHQIYHKVQQCVAKKPIFVQMGRIAASGGLYAAMGVGPEGLIFAEPTTWTGSIGVIIPRYDLSGLAEKLGVQSDSLKTGPLKDSLNPFRPMTERETEVWRVILEDAFERFIGVIADNRPALDAAAVRTLATGQVYTATQAQQAGLIDRIGFEEDALAALRERAQLKTAKVIQYEFPIGLLDLIAPAAHAADPAHRWEAALDRAVPKALYHCGGYSVEAEIPLLRLP